MLEEMALTLPLSSFISPMKETNFNFPNSFSPYKDKPTNKIFNFTLFSKPSLQVGYSRITRVQALKSDGTNSKRRGREPYSDSDSDDEDDVSSSSKENDPYAMNLEERKEWRRKIRQVMEKKSGIQEVIDSDEKSKRRGREPYSDSDSDDEDDAPSSSKENDPYVMSLEERLELRKKIRQVIEKKPDIQEVVDPDEKKKQLQKLINDHQLIVDEEDPDWPEDADDGWGFNLGQFFNKITIQNKKKEDKDDSDDDDDVDDVELEWQDDNYIRPIKDIKAAEWEETVFKDISPLIILVHNRYRRPKENEKIRVELKKAVHIIWNCRLPSPRCVALDAVVETELVAALKVSTFPEIIFTRAGKILFRDKAIRNADEWSKIMAFYYYRGAKPPCLTNIPNLQENIPSFTIENMQGN